MDTTENIRRIMTAELNAMEAERDRLAARYGQVWSTDEMAHDFTVEGFLAPFVVVERKSDGARGTLMFQHSPRYYFSFTETEA